MRWHGRKILVVVMLGIISLVIFARTCSSVPLSGRLPGYHGGDDGLVELRSEGSRNARDGRWAEGDRFPELDSMFTMQAEQAAKLVGNLEEETPIST